MRGCVAAIIIWASSAQLFLANGRKAADESEFRALCRSRPHCVRRSVGRFIIFLAYFGNWNGIRRLCQCAPIFQSGPHVWVANWDHRTWYVSLIQIHIQLIQLRKLTKSRLISVRVKVSYSWRDMHRQNVRYMGRWRESDREREREVVLWLE